MGISEIITAISALLTAIFAYVSFFSKKRNGLRKELEEIKALAVQNSKDVKEIKLDTTRLRLRSIIKNEPKNHDRITQIAYRYFIELGGDEEMYDVYVKWKKKEHIETDDWFKLVVERENKEK